MFEIYRNGKLIAEFETLQFARLYRKLFGGSIVAVGNDNSKFVVDFQIRGDYDKYLEKV